MVTIQFAIAILATYRMAHLLPEDEGPLFVFTRIRNFFFHKAAQAYAIKNSWIDNETETEFTIDVNDVTAEMLISDNNDDYGLWSNIYRGITCVYCCGLYAAIFAGLLMILNNYYANIFLLFFAIAGGQSLLQKMSTK